MHSPAHPGRLLASDLEALGVSSEAAAKAMSVEHAELASIIACERSLTGDMALRLEKVVGSIADHWMRMQAAYDVAKARREAPDEIESLSRLHAT